jgi:hypothetical protein
MHQHARTIAQMKGGEKNAVLSCLQPSKFNPNQAAKAYKRCTWCLQVALFCKPLSPWLAGSALFQSERKQQIATPLEKQITLRIRNSECTAYNLECVTLLIPKSLNMYKDLLFAAKMHISQTG